MAQRQNLQSSLEFMHNFEFYLRETKIVNHLNISGMGIPENHLLTIADLASKVHSLSAIHLSDLGLSFGQNKGLAMKVLDIFGVENSKMSPNCKD